MMTAFNMLIDFDVEFSVVSAVQHWPQNRSLPATCNVPHVGPACEAVWSIWESERNPRNKAYNSLFTAFLKLGQVSWNLKVVFGWVTEDTKSQPLNAESHYIVWRVIIYLGLHPRSAILSSRNLWLPLGQIGERWDIIVEHILTVLPLYT